jgi:hypothetical protein
MPTLLTLGMLACGDAALPPDTQTRDAGTDPAQADADADPPPRPADSALPTPPDAGPPRPGLDWRPEPEAFRCLTEWTPVRGFYLTNLLGRLDEAIAAAEAEFATPVPPGTVIQLIPQEAMVKLVPGASPETDDWEYLLLQVERGVTEVIQRGGAEVSNIAGSCFGCHVGASGRDQVCEQTGLCAAAALERNLVDLFVGQDPRCD